MEYGGPVLLCSEPLSASLITGRKRVLLQEKAVALAAEESRNNEIGVEYPEDDLPDHLGLVRFNNRVIGLVFTTPFTIVLTAIWSLLGGSWWPLVLGAIVSGGLLGLAAVYRLPLVQGFKKAWVFLDLTIALFAGLVFLLVPMVCWSGVRGFSPIIHQAGL